MHNFTVALTILALALLAYAALHDLAARTVPNWTSGIVFLLGVAVRGAEHSLWAACFVGVLVFAFLFILWLIGLMGGGDVKLWVAASFLAPPLVYVQLVFFSYIILFGGVIAVLYLTLLALRVPKPVPSRAGSKVRRLMRAEQWRMSRKGTLPYACAIAGGAWALLLPSVLKV